MLPTPEIFLIKLLLFCFTVPAPTIDITTMQPTYNGTNVTLTCTIRLNTAVDTAVNISGTWRNSTNVLTTSNTTSITVSETQVIEHLTYQTLLQFEPLGNHSRDGGSYVCEASVIPISWPEYIRNISNNGSFFLSVEGKIITSCSASECMLDRHEKFDGDSAWLLPQLFLSHLSSSLPPPLPWLGSHTPLPVQYR